MSIIKKAIFPVAGLGTRFLPITKASPKEMLPIVDKPLIQYAVEEAIDSGIKELIFVTSHSKHAIEDYFDTNPSLEANLKKLENYKALEIVRQILPKGITCIYIRQPDPLGLGHAVLCAKPLIDKDEPFAVLLADDLIDGNHHSCLAQMIEIYKQTQLSVVAVREIPLEHANQYGMIQGTKLAGNIYNIDSIIEKPKVEAAPSNIAVVGRYIFNPTIFSCLEKISIVNKEIQLTDAIADLILQEKVNALQFKGIHYDCGSKIGYLKAIIAYGIKNPALQKDLLAFLQDSSR
ncbi:MAG: UTP--glucose-1-phosphate uridylyltransferase GalU [Gammaproteobacteria bacterium]|nr:UTP--glucose-1-phosphate uridylyltransferase GalU [Gammaproteobacteria bacterium]